jgi:hypothetical protein
VASGAVRDLLLARGSWRAARTGRRSRRTGVPQRTETRKSVSLPRPVSSSR